jgi:hypothetical protein
MWDNFGSKVGEASSSEACRFRVWLLFQIIQCVLTTYANVPAGKPIFYFISGTCLSAQRDFAIFCCTQVRARYKLGDLPTTSEAIAQPGTALAQVY